MSNQKVNVRFKMVQTDADGNIKKYRIMDSRKGRSFEVPQFILRFRNWVANHRKHHTTF